MHFAKADTSYSAFVERSDQLKNSINPDMFDDRSDHDQFIDSKSLWEP